MRQGILGSGKARATGISLRICEERATQPEPKSPAALRVAPILICGFVVPQSQPHKGMFLRHASPQINLGAT